MNEIIDPNRLYDNDVLSDPHDLQARMREQMPVARTVDRAGREIFVVTDLALMEQIGRNVTDFSNDFQQFFMDGGGHAEVAAILEREPLRASLLLTNDPPQHTRYRAMVNAVFAMGRVTQLKPMIEQLVDDLIDGFVEKGRCDFDGEFAALLPTHIIADILGLEREHYGKVKHWSDATMVLVGRAGSKDDEIRAAEEIVDFRRYLRKSVVARRADPRDDLLSSLVNVRVDGFAPLDDAEATALAFEIAIAGNETTRHALTGGLVQLIRRPDQLQTLIDDPALIRNTVEEILRYETPASSMWRLARRDMVLSGVHVPAGGTILLRYDAGNRDSARFEDPDRFDIRRRNAPSHIAFGPASAHRCLGQMLARSEMEIAIPRVLSRLKNLRIAETSDTRYCPNLMAHGINSLHLTFDPGKRISTAS